MNVWPFRHHRRVCGSDEAVCAMEQGKRARREAEALHERVSEVAEQSSEIRTRNHFAAAVAAAFRGV